MAKLTADQRAKASDMAEKLASSTKFKRNPKFKGDRKGQAFAIATAKAKRTA